MLNFNLEKEFVEKLISYIGSKPWLEVQHLITPLLQAIQAEASKVENTVKVDVKDAVADVEKVVAKVKSKL